MTLASADLQKAVFEALAGDTTLVALLGGPKVFDGVPEGTPFPYVAFGRATVADWSTASERGEEHLFSLHVWSRARGRRQAQAIAARVRLLLEALGGSAGGSRLVQVRFRSAEWRALEDAGLQHCLLRFRAAVEIG